LLGVVDDYPMHLFSHSRHMTARDGVRTLFRTLLASAGTAIVAYAALAISGSHGLAQLGVFSLSGIFCAMLATCWLLPKLMYERRMTAAHDDTPQEFELLSWLWIPLLAVAIAGIVATGGIRWNDNLGELTPLPASLLARDHEMRQRFGAPDVRYLISINADSAQAALEQTEVLEQQLDQARQRGLLTSWSAVTAVLPSEATQTRRRNSIPAPAQLEASVLAATKPWPLRPSAFKPFLDDAGASRQLPAVTAADYKGGLLGDFVSSHLTGDSGRWRSVVYVTGLDSPQALAAWLESVNPGAQLVDLKAASESLVRGYRVRLFSILLAALVVIAALVIWYTGNVRRFIWSAGTVAASVLATLALVNWLHGAVTLFHLVSLVLVAGLGVDYCLFYSRPEVSRTEFRDTRHAVIACASSTAGGFAVLGTSSIPLLSTLGITVAIGTATMFVASRMGCRAK
jgi:predicted exporter